MSRSTLFDRSGECDLALKLPPAPPGFHGLRDDLPLRVYQRNLPHWRQDGATYFITFRLNDSLPSSKVESLKLLQIEWRADRNIDERTFAKLTQERVEKWLDAGSGRCVLRDTRHADVVKDCVLHFHGVRYEVGSFVVMPNHVHALIRPITHQLEDILAGIKSVSASRINDDLCERGSIWQEDTYDRIVRDDDHLWRCLQYIGRNPRIGGPSSANSPVWVNPDWQSLGWRIVEDS